MLRVYITILLLFSANCCFSQNWQRIHSPEGGFVTGLISHNGNLFASLLGGVYRSTNQALSWSEASTGLHSIMNNCLLSHHNRLLLGTDSGVYISDNAGVSWTHSSTGINYYNQPVRITQFLNYGSDSIIAATDIGLYCSVDSGNTWNILYPGFSATQMITCNGKIIATGGMSGSAAGVFISANGGLTFSSYNQGLNTSAVSSLAIIGGRIYAIYQPIPVVVDSTFVIYRDIDSVTGWTMLASSAQFYWPGRLFSDGSVLYLSSSYGYDSLGVVISLDSGNTWNYSQLSGLIGIRCLLKDGIHLFAGTEGSGIYERGGTTGKWIERNTGLFGSYLHYYTGHKHPACISSSSKFTKQPNGNIWYSGQTLGIYRFNGTQLLPVDSGIEFPGFVQSPVVLKQSIGGSRLSYLMGSLFCNTSFMFTQNNQPYHLSQTYQFNTATNQWNYHHSLANEWTPWVECGDSLFTINPDTSGLFTEVWLSNDTLQQVQLVRSFSNMINGHMVLPLKLWAQRQDRVLLAITDVGGIMRSSNAGLTWVFANAGLGDSSKRSITDIAFVYNPGAGRYDYFIASDTGLFKSTDKGLNWQLVWASAGLVINKLKVHNNHLVLLCNEAGAYYSYVHFKVNTHVLITDDGGQSFTDVSGNLGSVIKNMEAVVDIEIDHIHNQLLVTTAFEGIWILSLNGIINLTLPVELLSFSGKVYNKNAILNWCTASEKNSKNFILYRSFNGTHFDPVKTFKAAGTTDFLSTYTYSDIDVFNASDKVFYYLLQNDLNGEHKKSDILTLKIKKEIDVADLKVYPNPSSGRLYYEITSNLESGSTITFYNLVGYKCLEITVKEGKDAIDCSSLVPGYYIMKLTSPSGSCTKRVLIK